MTSKSSATLAAAALAGVYAAFTIPAARSRHRSATAMVMIAIAMFCVVEVAFGLLLYGLEARDNGSVGVQPR